MLSQILFRPPRRRKPEPITENDKELAKRKIRYLMQTLDAQIERFHTATTDDIRMDSYKEIQSIEGKIIQEMSRYGLVAEDFQ